MKNELKEKEVLAMYDVRGIQNYIFKSNAAKEIIGASALIDGIIVKGLQKYLSEKVKDEERKYYMTDWKQDEVQKFQQDQKIQMQVSVLSEVGMPMYCTEKVQSVRESIAFLQNTFSIRRIR